MFIGQPNMVNHNLVMRFQSLCDPTRLPIPKDDISRSCARRDVFAIGRECELTCVSGDSVPREPFLLVLSEIAVCAVHQDLIVQRLEGHELV
jgi:hypothetical protein